MLVLSDPPEETLLLYYSEPAMKGGGDQELQAQADSTGWNIKSKAPEGVEA